MKPAAVLDYNKYKTGVDRSDQMLSYYSFERKTIKWWKKLFFRLFDLVVVNAHVLHHNTSKKKMSLEIFYEKVAEGLLANAGTEMQVQGQTSSPVGRLVGRDHFLYRIPATHAKVEGTSQRSCRVCAERSERQTGKTKKKRTTMYCRKCDVGLCIGQCFEVYHTKLNYWE
jgi:maltodextrin utilization protein YvdJ